jgi:hypothetical protein
VERVTEQALRALGRARTPEALSAALEALPEADPRARDLLVEKYWMLAAERGRRDPGCHLRTAILRGLRRRAQAVDADLLEHALWTYELLPPGPQEVAGDLRGAALLALAQLDDRASSFHAVRLLGDGDTSRFSGEPALTAARLLAAQGQLLPLYEQVLRHEPPGEVALECLRALTEAPRALVARLAEERRRRGDEIALLGLVELLLGHPEKERLVDVLMAFVEESDRLDVVRYAATAIVAGREMKLIDGLRARAGLPGPRGELVREALALLVPP